MWRRTTPQQSIFPRTGPNKAETAPKMVAGDCPMGSFAQYDTGGGQGVNTLIHAYFHRRVFLPGPAICDRGLHLVRPRG